MHAVSATEAVGPPVIAMIRKDLIDYLRDFGWRDVVVAAPSSGTPKKRRGAGAAHKPFAGGSKNPVDALAVGSLAEMAERLSGCQRCRLHEGRTQVVFGVGSPRAQVIFIGEAPGADEDRLGEPFVGRAGQLLTSMLVAIGLRREDVYIANVLKCRPPENRTPAPAEIARCAPILHEQLAVRRPEVLKFYPDVPSQVVQTHHAGAWDGEQLSPNAIRQMLDASMTQLTGLNDAREAWASLFAPGERIAIKVNTFRNSLIWTHVPLVTAVTDSLQEAGVPAEQIIIFDYDTSELEEGGFQVNRDGPGVRCYGTDKDYAKGWKVSEVDTELSNVLLGCNALINMPVLKSHMITGFTFAMKNHYGTVKRPESLHSGIGAAMAELNALPEIKDRTRLVIGDVLTACLKYKSSFPYWDADYKGDSILVSFDPLAHDVVGLQMLTQLITESGGKSDNMMMAMSCIKSGAKWKLGASDPKDMELVELKLG